MLSFGKPFLLLFFCASIQVLAAPPERQEFTVMVFNVENLFDIDGEALFDDYSMRPLEGGISYSPDLLGKKLEFIAKTVLAVDGGRGPDVILFQELERDQTPQSDIDGPREFLREFEGKSIQGMLNEADSPEIQGLPSHAFLLKALSDQNLIYPHVALAASDGEPRELPAHINAVFSRFPIIDVESFPTLMAREILVVDLEVEGRPFTVINNHWKSGASNPETEVIRIENAKTVRRVLDRRLSQNPSADILVGGDLNSYYDQILLFPEMERTAMNSILGSQGEELSVAGGEEDLYNLWFELPWEERYTETWRDRKGTLMNLLITPGLYDGRGIRYVDNSFEVLKIPGFNVDEWGRPLRFRFAGGGRGGSDHLPIVARFEVVNGAEDLPMSIDNSGRESDQPGELLFVDYRLNRPGRPEPLPSDELFSVPVESWAERVGTFYEVRGRVVGEDPVLIDSGGKKMEVFCTTAEIWRKLLAFRGMPAITFFGELGTWDGKYQWVIRSPDWISP